jgi:hypothetical protein
MNRDPSIIVTANAAGTFTAMRSRYGVGATEDDAVAALHRAERLAAADADALAPAGAQQ